MWHTACMDSAPLPGLDSLDHQALTAPLIAHRTELESQPSELARRDAKLVAFATELESKENELVDQGHALLSRTEYNEHLPR
jgi:hypothetical protein